MTVQFFHFLLFKAVLYIEDRRIIVTSDELPLNAVSPSRLKSSSKFLLFTDSLVIIQVIVVHNYVVICLF